jgi:soluble lytic murein transglycosylase-like protein
MSRARRLILAPFMAALVVAGPARAAPSQAAQVLSAADLGALADMAAARAGMPVRWVMAVLRAESGGDPHAVSRAGAMGLMQLMPATWDTWRRRLGLGADPFDPRDNLMAGAAYLRALYDRYGPDGFLAAYNAGPARYEAHRFAGRPLPAETRAYLAVLAPRIAGDAPPAAAPARASWRAATLFPDRRAGPAVADGAAAAPQNATDLPTPPIGLFVRLTPRPLGA